MTVHILNRFRSRNRQAPLAAPVAAPRFANPHGIATPAKLAELAAQAQQQTATMAQPPWGPWDRPGNFPEPLRAVPDGHGRVYGHDITAMDNPPHHDRPYIPGVLGSEGRLSPRSAGVAEDLAGLVLFRASVERMRRPACPDCQQATGTWQERLYGTFKHHTWAVPEAAPREFGIATELRQAHQGTATAADAAEYEFAYRYLPRRAA